MKEVALVFGKDGSPIHWLDGASGVAIPDSRNLWDVIWENRALLAGVAHTHPWEGTTGPSGTDLTTFVAIEKGLGKRLIWPIVTMTHVVYIGTTEEDPGVYLETFPPHQLATHAWCKSVEELRCRSKGV